MKTLQNFFSRTILVVGLICGLAGFLPAQEFDKLIAEYKIYADECSIDTIKALRPEGIKCPDCYLIIHKNYNEVVTQQQLEERGYRLEYKWLMDDDMNIEYVFIKQPTLDGFIKWLEKRGKNSR